MLSILFIILFFLLATPYKNCTAKIKSHQGNFKQMETIRKFYKK